MTLRRQTAVKRLPSPHHYVDHCCRNGVRKRPKCETRAARLIRFRCDEWYKIDEVLSTVGNDGEAELLRSAYRNAFRAAKSESSIRSIAFPAISTGIYGFPKEEAGLIAVEVMRENERDFDKIVACLFDAETESIYRSELSA